MTIEAASDPGIARTHDWDWWTPSLEAAARTLPAETPRPDFLRCRPFLAWFAHAIGPACVTTEPGSEGLLVALQAAGLVLAPRGVPLRLCGPDSAVPANAPDHAVVLARGVVDPSAFHPGQDILTFDLPRAGGLCLAVSRNAAHGAVGGLLLAARDPIEARRIAALFEALADRLSLALELQAAQRMAMREADDLRRNAARAEARAVQETGRRQTIEASAPWRATQQIVGWLNGRPGLSRIVRRGARIGWHRLVRPLLRRRAEAPVHAAIRPDIDTAISVLGVGTLVFAKGPGSAPVTHAALIEAGRRTDAVAPPRAVPMGRIGRTALAMFFPGADTPPRMAALALRLSDGKQAERPMPPGLTLPPLEAIRLVLSLVDPADAAAAALLRDQILPMVEACWAVARQAPLTVQETLLGTPPTKPEVSIIVPLYGRMDWILLQAALFADDPALLSVAELIYVIDDPHRAAEAQNLARIAHQVYGVPLRMLQLSRNCGYSGATNAGARAARGRRLLLLNSDVLPISPGWLDRLQESFDAIDNCGALGCRLLFDDGTLQHAGMTFTPLPHFDAWLCDHPLKGEPAALDPATKARPVAAATGACLLVDAALYTEIGGLSEDYVIGDFEDAELCHRIAEAGRGVWYEPRVALTHFERQSLAGIGSAEWRYVLTLCNMTIHARRWGERLRQIASTQGGRG